MLRVGRPIQQSLKVRGLSLLAISLLVYQEQQWNKTRMEGSGLVSVPFAASQIVWYNVNKLQRS
jgi:hypothetical protein